MLFPLNLVLFITFRRLMWDSLAAVGTPAALSLIKDRILQDDMSDIEIFQAMIASVHMMMATEETLEVFKVRFYDNGSPSVKRRHMDLVSLFCSRT